MFSCFKNLTKRFIHYILPDVTSTLWINGIKLNIKKRDRGGREYRGEKSYKELQSRFFNVLRNSLKPDYILDIGANYGFTAIIMQQNFPNAKLMLVEADKSLQYYLTKNLRNNLTQDFDLIHAVCDDGSKKMVDFSLNPGGSQDNRVTGEPGWGKLTVPTTSINKILLNIANSKAIFIKIDTQGYERHVIQGGDQYLQSSKNWIIKMEFAPAWLRKQGTEPVKFLHELIDKYNVFEFPDRCPFHFNDLSDFKNYQILSGEVKNFVQFVESQNVDQKGWLDLIVMPKPITK